VTADQVLDQGDPVGARTAAREPSTLHRVGEAVWTSTPLTRTRRLRLVVEHAYDTPRLSRVALHRMPAATQE